MCAKRHVAALPDGIGPCAFYRVWLPLMTRQARDPSFCASLLQQYPADAADWEVLELQRWFQADRRTIFDRLKRQLPPGGRLIFDLDDLLLPGMVPKFNCYSHLFNDVAGKALAYYLAGADTVTLSTQQLKRELVRRKLVSAHQAVVIPNRLPRWWAEQDDPERRRRRFRMRRERPRIVFPSGISHYDFRDIGEPDDFSVIADWVIANRRRLEFVFFGALPPRLAAYRRDFTVVPLAPSPDFLRRLRELEPQLLIQPLRDLPFNRCKSDIKLLEAFALGIPILTQNLPVYSRNPASCRFDDASTLETALRALLEDEERYLAVAARNAEVFAETALERHPEEWDRVWNAPEARPASERRAARMQTMFRELLQRAYEPVLIADADDAAKSFAASAVAAGRTVAHVSMEGVKVRLRLCRWDQEESLLLPGAATLEQIPEFRTLGEIAVDPRFDAAAAESLRRLAQREKIPCRDL